MRGSGVLAISTKSHRGTDETRTRSTDVDGIESTLSSGASGLSYDATSDQYTYAWKTDKAWAGTCRQLVVKFNDQSHSTYRANFKFNK